MRLLECSGGGGASVVVASSTRRTGTRGDGREQGISKLGKLGAVRLHPEAHLEGKTNTLDTAAGNRRFFFASGGGRQQGHEWDTLT